MSGDAGDVEAACVVLDEDQRVDPAKIHQVDVQEVAGNDGFGLGCQELAPCRPDAAGSRADTGGGQDLPERGGADPVAQPGELPPGSRGSPSAGSPVPAAAPRSFLVT